MKVLFCKVKVQERAVSCSEIRVSEKSEERVTWFEEKSRVASAWEEVLACTNIRVGTSEGVFRPRKRLPRTIT